MRQLCQWTQKYPLIGLGVTTLLIETIVLIPEVVMVKGVSL